MRALSILLAVTIGAIPALADEATVGLDRVALIVPPYEDMPHYSSRIAIYFTLPEQVSDREIIYAELFIPLDLGGVEILGDSLLDMEAYDITSEWSEDNVSWDSPWSEPGGDIDSLSSYAYTITLQQSEDIHMDIRRFVRSIVDGDVVNHGLMLIPLKYDQPAFHFHRNIDSYIRNSTQVRITYK